MKICTVGAELFRANGHTDSSDEANSRFWQFCEKRRKIALCELPHRPCACPPVDGIMSATKPFAGFSQFGTGVLDKY